MEHYRTRPAQQWDGQDIVPYGVRRPGRAPLPTQGRGAGRGPRAAPAAPARPAARRAPLVPRALQALRAMPNPRLTGLGTGLFCASAMLVLGYLDRLLFGASLTVYGVLFVPVCALTALWVRRGDLLTAPVVVPIGFAVGLTTVAESGAGGVGARLMGLVTGLATEAGWLYGGTLVAGAGVLVRRIRLLRRRRTAAARRRTATGAASVS
ncbi:DUF6542 domain-containing protein [Streptomyces sp. NPDC003717]|uniref:DUF6542 domain-containing protein n=1 Tax=Streptomyces sp. NPDC003717 TaxID=3154276 RepID=UPI0033A553E6